MIGGTLNNNHLKRLQGELSEVLLTFSSINDTLKGLEHTVHKHGSVITDLGEDWRPGAALMRAESLCIASIAICFVFLWI